MEDLPVRKKIRLRDYYYSRAGYYFITICVKDRHEMLGKIGADVGAIINRPAITVELSEYGHITETAICEIPIHYEDVTVDKYVVMPNHIHMILVLNRGRLIIAPTNYRANISTVIQQLKRQISKQLGFSIFQRSFHDRIIRNEAEYQKIWRYIDENPARWETDCYFQLKKQPGAEGDSALCLSCLPNLGACLLINLPKNILPVPCFWSNEIKYNFIA